jgi:hypothetical protein
MASRARAGPGWNFRTHAGGLKECPRFAERATMIASESPSAVANRRHATYTSPLSGSIAIDAPWFNRSVAGLSCTGVLQCAPQSADEVNRMRDDVVSPEPLNFV